jgi:hypothetical protein
MKLKLLNLIIEQINKDLHYVFEVGIFELTKWEKEFLDEINVSYKEGNAVVISWEESQVLKIKEEFEKLKMQKDFI